MALKPTGRGACKRSRIVILASSKASQSRAGATMGFGKVECQDDSYSLMHQPCPYCLRLTRARAFLYGGTIPRPLWKSIQYCMVRGMTERLTAQDWIDFALTTLAQEGFDALKADVLARKLGISRGSFYWHFSDLGTFHARV